MRNIFLRERAPDAWQDFSYEAYYLFKEESYAIMGACFEVYKRKGCGFTEPIYQECLEIE